MTEYIPGTYVKGADRRVAKNAKQAVALAFDGYKLEPKPAQVTEAPSVSDDKSEESDDKPAVPAPGPRGPRPTQENNKP